MIYKIFRESEWKDAQSAGIFFGSPDDLRDGFIHFSAGNQVCATCDRYFSKGDNLVLAAADDAVLDALKWEVSRGGDKFPHLYGPLNVSAIRTVSYIRRGPDGRLIFPPEIP